MTIASRHSRRRARGRGGSGTTFPRGPRGAPTSGGRRGPGSGAPANPAATGRRRRRRRRREHAGRLAARGAQRVLSPAVAAARSGSRVSGGGRSGRQGAGRAGGGARGCEAGRAGRRRRRRRHVERPQLLHQPGRGRVRGVRGAHLLGHVWHCLHPPVRRRRQLHPALPGAEAQAAGERRPSHLTSDLGLGGAGPFAPEPDRVWAESSPPRPRILKLLTPHAGPRAPLHPITWRPESLYPCPVHQAATHFSRLFLCSRRGPERPVTGRSGVPCGVKMHLSLCGWSGLCVLSARGLAQLTFLTSFPAQRVHRHTVQPGCREQRGPGLERGGL